MAEVAVQDAMHRITDKLLNPSLPASKRIHTLWHEYEEGKTREARFVKDLDRLEMALQASEYERGTPLLLLESCPLSDHVVLQLKVTKACSSSSSRLSPNFSIQRSKAGDESCMFRLNADRHGPSDIVHSMNERQASQAGNTDYKHVEAPAAPSVPPVPQPPTPLVKLPNGSGQVTDADEEV